MNSATEHRTCPNCGAVIPANAPQGVCPKCLMAAAAVSTDAGPTDGKRPEPPSLERLAAAFPQLDVIEFIGQGGMGAVYKARQKQLDRIVALKVLPPGIGDDPAFAERFTREAKTLAKLMHPNIVALFEFGQADGIYYLLMEFVDGVSLGQLLRASRVSAREALAIVPQICDALQYAHDQGIVHRDIKPENILLDRRGRVKVADFGLAKLVKADAPLTPALSPSDGERVAEPGDGKAPVLTGAGKIMGTPNYMAPEQVEHPGEVDNRADIYALGVVFYQMLTGELPGKRIEPPSTKVQIDVRLDEVVLRALEKEPELRYQQASQVKTAVETISSSSAPGTGTAPLPARPAAARGRLRAALIVGVLVWLFVTGTVTLIAWIRPASWKVVAVISCPQKSQPGRPVEAHFKFIATMIELIQSDVILGRVIDRLELDERSGKLDQRWGKRNLGLKLTKAQAMVLLKRRLDVRSEGGTLIQVGVFGKRPEEPEEAMDIANTIAEELRAFRIEQHDSPAEMLEMSLRFTPPYFLLGIAAAFVLGLLAGGLVLLRGFLRRGSQARQVKKGVETRDEGK
jgi:tRNA A-37 threonylcarbamoyl transferase component Bud32